MRKGDIAAAAALSAFALSSPALAVDCDGLKSVKISDTTIISAEAVPAGDLTTEDKATRKNMPAFCRVAGMIKPSPDSDIELEVWMPSAGWNGKFEGIGNGGYAGSIGYGAMAAAVQHGYATASTDTGHHAGTTDAVWALGHPEKVTDFGYRAIHETAEKAKAIIHDFYGEAPKRSYFSSCSNGGRQALMEAQRHPQAGEILGLGLRHFLEDHAIRQLLRGVGIAPERHANDLLTVGGNLQHRRRRQQFARVLELFRAVLLRPADDADLYHDRAVVRIDEREGFGLVSARELRANG